MHDGPAQSLTNIVLQAQIVERLLARDPEMAHGEVRQLVSMVQQTLDATKSFIFDVRPMVLDDLGLVPTLRRAARERGQRSGVSVEFESMGTDRRLPMELESGLFRIFDEALTALPGRCAGSGRTHPRLDAGAARGSPVGEPRPVERDRAGRAGAGRGRGADGAGRHPEKGRGRGKDKDKDKELPPALMAMMDERRVAAGAAADAARSSAVVALPAATWREVQQRAATVGVATELVESGSELRISVDLAQPGQDGAGAGSDADAG